MNRDRHSVIDHVFASGRGPIAFVLATTPGLAPADAIHMLASAPRRAPARESVDWLDDNVPGWRPRALQGPPGRPDSAEGHDTRDEARTPSSGAQSGRAGHVRRPSTSGRHHPGGPWRPRLSRGW